MSERLQVLFEEQEMKDLREAAGKQGLTVSEWVRRAVRDARRREPKRDLESKLAAIRKAAEVNGPTADIEQMLAEIEQGALASDEE